jgi:hypothetical protein
LSVTPRRSYTPTLVRLAMVESPYRGDRKRNLLYLHRLIRYVVLERGCSPYASHLMLTMALDDNLAAERSLGIISGYAWAHRADIAYFGLDYGISGGMRAARDYYDSIGLDCVDLIIGPNEEEDENAQQDPEAAPDDGGSSAFPYIRQEGGDPPESGPRVQRGGFATEDSDFNAD